MTLINIVLIYTIPGPARPAGKRSTSSGSPRNCVISVKFSIRNAEEERKPNKVIVN